MNKHVLIRLFATWLTTFVWLPVSAAEPDLKVFDRLLEKYVAPGEKQGLTVNLVDYPGLSRDPRFALLVEQIRAFDVNDLTSDDEKLAFYINAYNILTIQLILDNWPIKSIRDIGGLFKGCLLYTSPSPRDRTRSRMPSSA